MGAQQANDATCMGGELDSVTRLLVLLAGGWSSIGRHDKMVEHVDLDIFITLTLDRKYK
jgi:hypothetical protein